MDSLKLILFIVGTLPTITQATEVRLVDAFLQYGLVEIKESGVWTPVLGDKLSRTEASVICRSAGLSWADVKLRHFWGVTWNMTYKVLDIDCRGDEMNIDQCANYSVTANETAFRNLRIACRDLRFQLHGGSNHDGIVEVYDADRLKWRSVCTTYDFNQEVATFMCRKSGLNSSHALNVDPAGYPTSSTSSLNLLWNCIGPGKSNCSVEVAPVNLLCHRYNQYKRVAAVICSDNPPRYRLVDGQTRQTGRFEVFVNNTWGPVCYDILSQGLATVACNALGLSSTDARYAHGKYIGGPISPNIGYVKCIGNETSFEECDYVMWVPSNCDNYLTISCGEAQEEQIRLNAGYDELSGHVEVYYNGSWGSVCRSGFDDKAAAVVCNNVSTSILTRSTAMLTSFFDRNIALQPAMMIENITCNGSEASLLDCPHTRLGMATNCSMGAGVTCGYGGETLRLSDGGILEVLHNGEWGTICGAAFKHVEAFVACKTLNKTSSFGARISARDSARNRSGRIWMDGITCIGIENSLFDCNIWNWGAGSCSHEDDVAILCQDIDEIHTNVTLGGESMIDNLGFVLLDVAGEWGTVCGHEFGENEAKVVCRSLGLGTYGAKVVPNTELSMWRSKFSLHLPQTIWLDDVVCHGGEESLLHCQHSRIGLHFCYHGREAAVVYCGPPDDGAVRLVGGIDANSGRVEVKLYGQWGTVCDNYFGDRAARVVCRQLNLPSSGAASTNKYASGSGYIWLDSVICDGDESSLTDCFHGNIGSTHCSHIEDVGVECKESPVATTGTSSYNAYHHRSDFPIGGIIGIVIGGVALTVFVISMIVLVVIRRRQPNATPGTVHYIAPNNNVPGSNGQIRTLQFHSAPPSYGEVAVNGQQKPTG